MSEVNCQLNPEDYRKEVSATEKAIAEAKLMAYKEQEILQAQAKDLLRAEKEAAKRIAALNDAASSILELKTATDRSKAAFESIGQLQIANIQREPTFRFENCTVNIFMSGKE